MKTFNNQNLSNEEMLKVVGEYTPESIIEIINEVNGNTFLPTCKTKIDKCKLDIVLHQSSLKPNKWKKIHQCYTKLIDTQIEEVINFVNGSSIKEIEKFMVENFDNNKLWNVKPTGKTLTGLRTLSYVGGKFDYNPHQQIVGKTIIENGNIDTYVDGMMGNLGSTLSLSPILYKNNIKTVCNDYNKKTSNVFVSIKENSQEVMKIISDFSRTIYLKFEGNYDWCMENKEVMKEISEIITKKVQSKERKGCYDVEHGTYLLMLGNLSFNGNYEVKVENTKGLSQEEIEEKKMKGETVSYYSFTRGSDKILRMFNKLQKKVFILSQIFNLLDIEFTVGDYKEVCEKYDSENTLILLDPPYTECHMEYEKEVDLENIKPCSSNYGLIWKDKIHLEVLDFISNVKSEIMYWNYKHTVVKHYQLKNGFQELEIPFKDGSTGNDKINYLMWSNKGKKVQSNNSDYCVIEDRLVG